MSEAPERIYLQWYEDDDGTLGSINESSWCSDKINDDDVEYVLASKLADARAAARFVWACGKHRMWINYREEAMKKWPWMDSDEEGD